MERKGQRITQLPGENGFHARDGSLTKKKREQWEKEKAEAEKHSWFPFGRKTLANKKSIIKEKNNDQNAEMQNSRMENQNTQKNNLEMNVANSNCNSSMAMEQQTIIPNESINYSGHGQIPPIQSSPYPPLQQIHITANPSPILPIYMEYPPHPATPLYHPMSNFFPIQTAQQFAQFPPYPMPISAPTFLDPIFLPHQKVPFSMLPTPPFSGSSSSDSANSPPKDGQKEIGQQNQNQTGIESNSTQMANLRWQEELDKQLAEKRMAEEMEMEKRIMEQKRLEKEEFEKNKREEEERMAEERRRTQKIEIRDQNEQTYLDGIQRAQKEAELLKRAKLFRHILADGEAELEVAKEVLKSDDDKMVKEVLKQLRELEFQRRIAAENISFSAGQKQTKSPKTPQQGDAGKEKGSGERKQQQNSPKIGGPFQRAKSWNVKQQRTIPSPSMLPIPIRLKEKQNESGQKNNSTNGQPKVRFAANKSPKSTSSKLSVPPKEHKFVAPKPPTGNNNNKPKCNNSTSGRLSGLFEQLTLRRPRLGSFGSKEQRRMTLSGGQNVAENAVDLNGNFAADDEKNATKLDRLNSNVPPKNGVNSTPSTQANSPTSSSIETASVVKFRHLLLSPTNSQEDDLSFEFPPLPPVPRIPIGSAKRKDGQFLVPQSPFSRKNSTNDGNKDCFGEQGIRRSLRSPTMRRLQDSLQSLATIDGNEGQQDESRSSTPKPFNCRNPQYRSFNMRKDIARQKQILENLASVRAQLKSSQAQLEKTLSKQNLAGLEEQQQSSSNKNGESFI